MLKDYDEQIKSMLQLGFNVTDIAKKLGYRKESLYLYMRQHNYTGLGKKIKIEQIKEYAKTHTKRELAERFSYTYQNIHRLCKKYNIEVVMQQEFKKRGAKAERNTMIAYLADKFTYESIGKVFGVTKERIRQIYEREKAN